MAKKKIVYKVVHSESRNSFGLIRYNRYCMYYPLKAIVKAIKGSVGIMCFETKESAEIFISHQYVWEKEELEIIDVRPIGKANYPKSVSAQTTEGALNNFYEDEAIVTMHPPKGTVCYKSVKVLT